MIGPFIESLLGSVGRAIYHVYERYSLYINGFIILYGLCVFLAHRSFYKTLEEIKKELGIDLQTGIRKAKLSGIIRHADLQWETLSRATQFPFIAIPGKIVIHIKNKNNLEKIFSTRNLLILLAEEKKEKKSK